MTWTKAKTAMVTGAILLFAGAATTVAIVQTKKPAPPASGKTEKVVADRTTPKGTMLVMSQAMEAGDGKKYVESYVLVTAEELKLKGSLESLVAANAKFKKALAGKFGDDAANGVFSNLPFVMPADYIQSATEKIEGDSATVNFAGGKGGRPVQFTKINDKWKMAADGFWHLKPAVMSDILGRALKAMDETIVEIERDKYKTPIEAVDAMKAKAR